MPILTLLTDYGLEDHYVAAVKAKLLRYVPELHIVDISHQVNVTDIGGAAFMLNAVLHDFPDKTIHLVGVDEGGHHDHRFLIAEIKDQIVVLPDNGMLGLLAQKKEDVKRVFEVRSPVSSFTVRDTMVDVCTKLINGQDPVDQFSITTSYKMLIPRMPKYSKQTIVGHVIRIESTGNVISNIEKSAFDTILALPDNQDAKFHVKCRSERLTRINKTYSEVGPGDCFVLFNSLGLLEIGIYQGNASQLLGLSLDAPIFISFEKK